MTDPQSIPLTPRQQLNRKNRRTAAALLSVAALLVLIGVFYVTVVFPRRHRMTPPSARGAVRGDTR